MIRINIDQPELDKLIEQHYKAIIASPYQVFVKLNAHVATSPKEGVLILALIRYFKKIIIGKPDELQILANQLKPLLDDVLEEIKASKSTKAQKTEAVKT